MTKIDVKKVLILAPHADDAELCCGGMISSLAKRGAEIFVVVFSTAEASLPKGFMVEDIKNECIKGCGELGVKQENIYFFDFPVRFFHEHRQEILERLIKLRSDIAPCLVVAPSGHDCHQDHNVIAIEAVRAFRTTSLLGFEAPWNNLLFNNACVIELEEEDVLKKAKALSYYRSQAHRRYTSKEVVFSLAIAAGLKSGRKYAEIYEVVRWFID